REDGLHDRVQRFFTLSPQTPPTRQGGSFLRRRKENALMTRKARFCAQQGVWLTLASALLCLAFDTNAPLYAASLMKSLPRVGPAVDPPQGMLLIYSERYVIADDGVLVFHRRPMELYTENGQLVGSYAPLGDAPIRLDVPPGNYLVVSQRQGVLQKVG